RCKNPNFSDGGIMLKGQQEKGITPQGEVISVGFGVKDIPFQIEGKVVRFNGSMVVDMLENERQRQFIYVYVPSAAIVSVDRDKLDTPKPILPFTEKHLGEKKCEAPGEAQCNAVKK